MGRPKDLLIYYGWLSGFNAYWNNEKVAQDIAQYGAVVFGDGVQDPSHGDYANTQIIIPRVKELNPKCKIFGYVTTAQDLTTFTTKAGQWNTLGVHGIFMDEAGYDYGTKREDFNDRVDVVHGQSSANIAFPNAWNLDHILGLENDPSYPNSTFNKKNNASALTSSDVVLLESFGMNTLSYPNKYEDQATYLARAEKAIAKRCEFGISLAGSSVVKDDDANAQTYFDFAYVAALMASLDYAGSSDENYGASSGKCSFWTRLDTSKISDLAKDVISITADVNTAAILLRYSSNATLKLDFTSGSESSSLTVR